MKAIMNLQTKKQELVQMILNTEKPSVLAKVEVDRGELIPHVEVMEKVRAKYYLD